MNAPRQSVENHWRGVGRLCARSGWSIDKALTGRPSIDALIREGYEEQERRERRKERN